MACWKALLASVVFVLAASSARAGDRETQERAAQKACLLGDFKKGIEILADLYLDTHDPTYIYNQGRCLEQNGQNQPAILHFQEYLRWAGEVDPPSSHPTSVFSVLSVVKKLAFPPYLPRWLASVR